MASECIPRRTLARVQLSPSSALIMTPWPIVPTRMFPLVAMTHLRRIGLGSDYTPVRTRPHQVSACPASPAVTRRARRRVALEWRSFVLDYSSEGFMIDPTPRRPPGRHPRLSRRAFVRSTTCGLAGLAGILAAGRAPAAWAAREIALLTAVNYAPTSDVKLDE